MSAGKRFVIGDIHGCALTFRELLFNILKINKNDTIYLLGDYVDRGPRIKQTVDTILELIKDKYKVFPLIGNHEAMMLEYIEKSYEQDSWFRNKGRTTMDSFNLKSIYDLDLSYLEFFKSLEYYYLLDDFVLTHAGLNFNIENPLQDKEAMLWNRDYFVDKKKIGGRRLISGHSPHTLEKIRYFLNHDKIQLDGGCVYLNIFEGMGYLCALELNTMEFFSVLNIDY